MQYSDPLFRGFREKDDTLFERDNLYAIRGLKWTADFTITEDTYPIGDIEDAKHFLTGVVDYLNNNGSELETDDTQGLVEEVFRRYTEKAIPLTQSLRKTLRNWLSGIKPSQDQAYRHNCYNFCFALGMDLETAAEFLFKHFQIMPFNFKSRVDAVYFYCFLRKRDYATVAALLERVKTFAPVNDDAVFTSEIGRNILEIDDDEEFVRYLETQCFDQEHQSMTARKRALALIDENKEIIRNTIGEPDRKIPDSKLLAYISGYNNQVGCRDNKGLSKGMLPTEFTKAFPNGTEISKIRKGDKVSDDSLRKLLILLNFFNYYGRQTLAEKRQEIRAWRLLSEPEKQERVEDCREEFCAETNTLLAECGYVQLYPRNLFDWHFLCCANSADPIGVLKALIKQLYSDVVSEIN